jgi:hypothetical protein
VQRIKLVSIAAVLTLLFSVQSVPKLRAADNVSLNTFQMTGSPSSVKSVATSQDGLPIILVHQPSSASLYLYVCLNQACDQPSSTQLATGFVTGPDFSLVIQSNGLPMIWYRNSALNRLDYIRCGNQSCSQNNVQAVAIASNSPGSGVKAILAPNGNVWAFYRLSTGNDLGLTKCNDAQCTTDSDSVVYATGLAGVAPQPSLSYCSESDRVAGLNPDACVIVSHSMLSSSDDVALTVCNVDCSSSTTSVFDEAYDMGSNTRSNNMGIHVQPNGLPAVFRTITGGRIELVSCQSLTCSTAASSIIVNGNASGNGFGIVRGDSGFPLLAYTDSLQRVLGTIQCSVSDCSISSTNLYDGINSSPLVQGAIGPAAVVNANGIRTIISHNASTMQLTRSGEPAQQQVQLNTFTVANTPNNYFPSIVGQNGFPTFLAAESATGNISLSSCKNANCSLRSSPQTFGMGAVQSTHYAIARQADGMPMIWYRDGSANALKFIRCQTFDCSISLPAVTATLGSGAGTYVKVVMSPTGTIWAFWKKTSSNDLMVTRCQDTACSATITSVVSSVGNVGSIPQPVLGYCSESDRVAARNPDACVIVASVNSGIIDNVDVSICDALSCALLNNVTINGVYSMSTLTPTQLQLAILPSGLPVIARNVANNKTEIIECLLLSCSNARSSIVSDDSTTSGGVALVVNYSNGLPRIYINGASNRRLVSVQCNTESCNPALVTNTHEVYDGHNNSSPNVENPLGITGIVSGDGFPFIVSRNAKTIQLTH